jgi:hypothetical protein
LIQHCLPSVKTNAGLVYVGDPYMFAKYACLRYNIGKETKEGQAIPSHIQGSPFKKFTERKLPKAIMVSANPVPKENISC